MLIRQLRFQKFNSYTPFLKSYVKTVRIMSTFDIKFQGKQVPVKVPEQLSVAKSELLEFRPFTSWIRNLENSVSKHSSSKFVLRNIEIQSVDKFSKGKVGFVKLKADFLHPNGKPLPGIAVLRGGTTGMLVVLTAKGKGDSEKYVLLVSQPRVAAGSIDLVELPAGMIDDGTFAGAAAKELEEECGIKIEESDLVNLLPSSDDSILLSPGLLDEEIKFFLYHKEMPLDEIKALEGKLMGNHGHSSENEVITLRLLKFQDAEQYTRDAKLIIALSLYNRHKRAQEQ
ncbi:hypothetical protein AWJ20_1306 [Sugiyamaella lignohabitans]|uniref:Nudix hydrolase domain-containing protein n=1 Tax=Sugiyamaella lignohabitans TaxID=796027 RepID=A0A167DKZ9_9ASCO|nr:uncharacterized protein AWJ20_1306 [Sugiyamaella lignohabitans]ANB13028.1 hypothetical protein AWJ20_1306 [Sugiyamaella lignohabitans]